MTSFTISVATVGSILRLYVHAPQLVRLGLRAPA